MAIDFEVESEFQEKLDWIQQFCEERVGPLHHVFPHAVRLPDPAVRAYVRDLQQDVKDQGLWALFLDEELGGPGFGQLKLALVNEILGRYPAAPQLFGAAAPDTGNMEVLAQYGTPEQQEEWLKPMLEGEIRSAFGMTEPNVASSDATNIQSSIVRDGDTYVNVNEVMPNLSLRKIKIFQFAGHDRLHSLVDAEKARFVEGAWQMNTVKTTIIDDEGFVQMKNDHRQAWQTSVTQEMMKMFVVQPAQLSMAQLRTYIDHLARNHQDARASELAYWSKWMLPVSTAIMVILAIPFVLGSIRSGTMGRNLFFGSLMGLAFFFFSQVFGYVVLVHGVAPLLGATLPSVMFLGIAMMMYRRVL